MLLILLMWLVLRLTRPRRLVERARERAEEAQGDTGGERPEGTQQGIDLSISQGTGERILFALAILALAWLAGGLLAGPVA